MKSSIANSKCKFGLFINSHSSTVVEQFSHSGYDWLLIDSQHGPMNPKRLAQMIGAGHSGGAFVMVRVAHPKDRAGIQQALDLGADGILVPTVNNSQEAAYAVSCANYPTKGTRSVYNPMIASFAEGLLGYVGGFSKRLVVAVQIETADGVMNVEAIAKTEGVDMLFLGPNDLCMSAGLYERYKFPDMYTSPELNAMTDAIVAAGRKHNKALGVFVFGTARVGEYIRRGFSFISIGNDLDHVATQAAAHLATLKKLVGSSAASSSSSSSAVSGGSRARSPEPDGWAQVETLALVAVIAGLVMWLSRPH